MSNSPKPPRGSVNETIAPRAGGSTGDIQETIAPSVSARRIADETVAPSDTSRQPLATLDLPPTPAGLNATIDSIPSLSGGGRSIPVAAPRPQVEGYTILSELGRGGMGVVYKARQKKLNRIVALKMVLAGAHAGADQLARFFTEAEAVAHLQQQHIVQIYEVGEHEGLPYFSLEYVDGGCLADRIDGKPQPEKEAAHMVEQLARAMAYAHEQGIIHRDLKPANVLLTKQGEPKITDFGLAKKLEGDSGQTKSGTLMGTPNYMAPEQARGLVHEIGPLVDVYALGVILYEMLTGRTPFLGTSILDTLQQVRNQEPVAPSHLQPKVPRDLETICLKCLQKESAKRYESALAMADDLARFLAGEPIRARRVGRVERAWRWCKRNPRIAALSTAVALLLLTAGSLAAYSARQEIVQRKKQEAARQEIEQRLINVRSEALRRLDQAKQEVAAGNFPRALVVLDFKDPDLASAAPLRDVHGDMSTLREQINLYLEFEDWLDNARYYGLFGSRGTLEVARDYSKKVLALYEQIKNRAGRGLCGLPPLTATQQEQLKEEFFEAFLVAAHVEREAIASIGDLESQRPKIEEAVRWLDEADTIYPSTWVLPYRRRELLKLLGNDARAQADESAVQNHKPSSPLDRFWYGLVKKIEGSKQRDPAQAQARFREAIQEYAAVVRMRPDHYWAYYDGGTCHYQLGNYSDAVMFFSMCVQVRPEVAWAYGYRGSTLAKQNQHQAAIEDFTRAIERNKQYTDPLVNRALSYFAVNSFDSSLADFTLAAEINPGLVDAFRYRADVNRKLGRIEDAFSDYERALAIDPSNTAVYVSRGSAWMALEDFANARKDFSRLIALQPKQPNYYRMRGIASQRLLDFEAAHRDWEAWARLPPKSPDPYQRMAGTFRLQGRYDESVKAVNTMIQLNADNPLGYLYRAQAYHQQGKLQEALTDQLVVQEKLKAKSGDNLNDYGDLLRTLGRIDDAAAAYSEAIQLQPKQTDAYVSLALLHWAAQRPEQAEATLKQVFAANPPTRDLLLYRAEFSRLSEQWEAALADCEAAENLDPKSPLPAVVRAAVAASRGDAAGAIQAVDEQLKAARQGGHLLLLSARVYSIAAEVAERKSQAEQERTFSQRSADLLAEALKYSELNFQAVNRILVDPSLVAGRRHPRIRELLPVLKQLEPE